MATTGDKTTADTPTLNPLPITDGQAFDAIVHFLLMGWKAYPTPEDAAAGLLKRLAHEGYCIVRHDLDGRAAS